MSKSKYKIICDTDPKIWDEKFFVVGFLKPFGYILTSNGSEDEMIIPEETIKATGCDCLVIMRLLRDSYRALRDEEGVSFFRVALVDDDGNIEELEDETLVADPDW